MIYTWTPKNRLLSITEISTGHVSSFTYDGMGRRVAITETTGGTATTTGYLWCGNQLCASYAAGAITARYQADGETRYAGATATPYYYERDHLGTVTSMTSATGTTLGTLTTDAYGLTLSQSGAAPTFGYAGMFVHQPTSSIPPIYLTMFRAYDPYSGRWLSRDPAGEFLGGLNLYAYADENPVDKIDPLGTQFIPGAIAGAIAGAVGGAAAAAGSDVGECTTPTPGDVALGALGGAIAGGIAGFFGGEVGVADAAFNSGLSLTGGSIGGLIQGGATGSSSCGCNK